MFRISLFDMVPFYYKASKFITLDYMQKLYMYEPVHEISNNVAFWHV